jgi:hypothetical protein
MCARAIKLFAMSVNLAINHYYFLIPQYLNDILPPGPQCIKRTTMTMLATGERMKTVISFCFHNNRPRDAPYKLNPTEADNRLLSEHYLAGFSGDLSTGHTNLTYFPSKNLATIEYNPN